jgi:hypothetical protein
MQLRVVIVVTLFLALSKTCKTNPEPTVQQRTRLRELHCGIWLNVTTTTSGFSYLQVFPKYTSLNERPSFSRNISVFLIGDSLDRNIVSTAVDCRLGDYFPRDLRVCSKTSSNTTLFYGHAHNDSFVCHGQHVTVANLFVRGLIQGDHQNEVCELGLPAGIFPSLEMASKHFITRFGHPDIVVVKSFFWDLLHLCRNLKICRDVELDRTRLIELLRHHEGNVTMTVKKVRLEFPHSIVALRTDPLWKLETNRFGPDPSVVREIGMQLNQVIRYVAARENALLFDFFHIFEGLAPEVYLFDDIHIHGHYSKIELNIILHTLLTDY